MGQGALEQQHCASIVARVAHKGLRHAAIQCSATAGGGYIGTRHRENRGLVGGSSNGGPQAAHVIIQMGGDIGARDGGCHNRGVGHLGCGSQRVGHQVCSQASPAQR